MRVESPPRKRRWPDFRDSTRRQRANLAHDFHNNCRRFPLKSEVERLSPVKLPPGRARLATIPPFTGSPTATMTMGIVLVAAICAGCWRGCRNNDVHFDPQQFRHDTWETFISPVRPARFEDDVLSLYVASSRKPCRHACQSCSPSACVKEKT